MDRSVLSHTPTKIWLRFNRSGAKFVDLRKGCGGNSNETVASRMGLMVNVGSPENAMDTEWTGAFCDWVVMVFIQTEAANSASSV